MSSVSFGCYGAVRKRASVDSTTGLWLETSLLMPFAAAFLYHRGVSLGAIDDAARPWLLLAGLFTVVPLMCMVFAARRIELGTLGFIQYITPVSQFVIAVALYGERIDTARALAFATTILAVGLWLAGLRRAQSEED